MPRKDAPEFSYDEKSGLYCKKAKNPTTGKWVKIYGHTKAEVKDKKKDREKQWGLDASAAGCPYVHQYAATWYRLNTVGLSAKRLADYKSAINNHICPVIGEMLMRDVTSDDALSVLEEASELSKSAQSKIVTTMKRIFEAAEDAGVIQRSPCRKLKASGAASAEKKPLTAEQQAALIAAVKDTPAYTFVMLGLYAGLRREEILALQWDQVHLDDEPPYLSVRRAMRWEKNQPIVTDELKSKASKRDIPLPAALAECLAEEALRSLGDYVIADTKGNAMSMVSYRRRVLDPITVRTARMTTRIGPDGQPHEVALKVGDKVRNHPITISLDFHVTPHLLRHTYITRLILAGVNIKTVQYLAGHATVQLTLNIYTHLMENQPRDTAGAVEKAFA